MDPLAEKHPGISPYAYCANNSIRLIDPDGMDWFVNNETGAIYNNNTYSKDDLSKLDGKGWSWFGANGMFMKDPAPARLYRVEDYAGDKIDR